MTHLGLPLIAATLLVLVVPAFAGDIEKFGYASMRCIHLRTGAEGGEVGEAKKYCDAQDKLRKKLEARGYCTYGKGGVGRAGRSWSRKEWERVFNTSWQKGRKHCYTL